jgi:DNA-binding CsgD family transcriptional regulator/uncharacterized membrane protein YgcG
MAELAGLPELVVEGLGDDDARRLLASAIQGRLDERVRDRIVAETRGNPLALLELPRGLTPAELAGGFGMPTTAPLASTIEESFLRRLDQLPEQTRRLLLVTAAEPVGDASLLWRAAGLLGIDPAAAAPAESAGLIELGGRVGFRHPLVRSAIYAAADPDDRRLVHAALAEATDPALDPDRRAWHRAHATSGPVEEVAQELERSADRAYARGGVAAAAAFLERATELTPDPAVRGARALAAAQAKLDAAAPDAAGELIAISELGPLDPLQRARADRLHARVAFARTRGDDAPPLLLDAARRLERLDPALARETYLEALAAAIYAGRLGTGPGVVEIAEAARAATRAGDPGSSPRPPLDLLLDGLVTRFTDGYGAAVPLLRRALAGFLRTDGRGGDGRGGNGGGSDGRGGNGGGSDGRGDNGGDATADRWLWLACRVAPDLWDDAAWQALAERGVDLAREAGALTVLPSAANYRAGVHVHAGEFGAAAELVEEADAITQTTGIAPLKYATLMLAAWRGQEATALRVSAAGVQDATARGEGMGVALTLWTSALLFNGLGRYDKALVAAQQACEHDDLGVCGWALAELVEASSRHGEREVAADALERLSERTRASGSEWALGVEAVSRALLDEGKSAQRRYEEALERLAGSRVAVQLARARLLYGEWLRRENRRLDAREQLRLAHEQFSRIGADAFAERARRELLATGETVRRRTDATLYELTPQEAQIARLARDGQTNPEIGARLFISPRTVEYHLRKVFAKLGINSRRELRRAQLDAPAADAR